MPKNQTLDEFYSTFREEVLCASDTETSGWTTEDFLTNVKTLIHSIFGSLLKCRLKGLELYAFLKSLILVHL